jgi:glycosyltransferase involved in cell wall biosynthesis
MRVLLVSHHFPPDGLGGVERYTEALAAQLTSGGDQVSILARRSEKTRKDFRLLRESLVDGTTLFRMVTGEFRFEHFMDNHEAIDRIFTLAALEAAPDVVHINHLMGFSPRFIQIAHRLGAAVVVSLHDFYFVCPRVHLQKPTGELCSGPDGGHECARTCFTAKLHEARMRWSLRKLYFEEALRMAERAICYSDYVASYFQRAVGHPAMEMIPNGVLSGSLPGECGAASKRPGLRLAYLGTVAPHKGLHVILDALRAAELESVHLHIIGQVPSDRECRDYANRLRMDASTIPGLTLRMYGAYERRELAFLLQDIDGVVVPSLVPEAGPIVPREALSHGIPVIAARIGALPELIHEGQNGFLFDSRRPVELAGILIRLAASEELRMRLHAGASGSVIMTVPEHTRRVRAVYDAAIRDFHSKPDSAKTSEFNALHTALLRMGCDSFHQASHAQPSADLRLPQRDSGVLKTWN